MQKANHFFWRAGFGPTPNMLCQSEKFKPDVFFDAMWLASAKYNPLQVAGSLGEGLMNGLGEAGKLDQLSKEQRAEMVRDAQKKRREEIRSLNLKWLDEMTWSNAQLREKMAFFWHGHFACRNLNSFFQQQLLDVIRQNALGNFADLLREVSKTPAMLQFLNNQQNRKQSPNENFAREVMELFTMGRGHYGEKDIKEAARAFTGWGYNLQGEFVARDFQHDDGSKTFLGKTGRFTGDDVIDILLERKETATYVTTKLYKFLVSDSQVDANRIAGLADILYRNNYELKPLLAAIFTSSWFYDDKVATPRIKSPVELWVGLRRLLGLDIENPAAQLLVQRNLGQVLFYPPNVAGWPGGTNWIDSSSLLLRMRLGLLAGQTESVNLSSQTDDDADMGMMRRQAGVYKLAAKANWIDLQKSFDKGNLSSYPAIAKELLQATKVPDAQAILNNLPAAGSTDDKQRLVAALLASPEYQLC